MKFFRILKAPFLGPARMGRVDYINLCVLLSIFTLILLISSAAPVLLQLTLDSQSSIWWTIGNLILVFLFRFTFFIRLNNSRLHDLNCSGWWNIFAIIPLVSMIFYFVLFIMPGSKDINEYASKPNPPSHAKKLFSILSLITIGAFTH